MSRNNFKDLTPYAVQCQGSCLGPQFLTEEEYQKQMSRKDCTWRCPTCGDLAFWDDDSQETS